MQIIEFVSLVQELKDIERTGWNLFKVKNPESVSDHCFILAVLSMLFAEERKLDVEKCVKMALIHDIGEVYTKDIATRFDESNQAVSNSEKKNSEERATIRVLSILPEKYQRKLFALWKEFEEGNSEEAKLVRDLDRIEMVLQTLKYKKRTSNGLDEFFWVANREIKDNEMKKILSEIEQNYRK